MHPLALASGRSSKVVDLIIGDPIPDRIADYCNDLHGTSFSLIKKSRTLRYMDLDETWQVGLRREKTKPFTFPAKSHYGFRREREKMGRRGVVF